VELLLVGPRGSKEATVVALWKLVKRNRSCRSALRTQDTADVLQGVQHHGSAEAKESAEKIMKKLKRWC
jgi:hypothetical protein